MDRIAISRQRAVYGLVISGVAGIGILAGLLPDLIVGTVPLRSFEGALYVLGLALGGGFFFALAVYNVRLLLDRRQSLEIVGDRLEIHPFWMTECSIGLNQIARVTYESYKYSMDYGRVRRYRLRIDRRPGLGDGEPIYLETWRMMGGDAAGKAFGEEVARRAGVVLETDDA